MQALAASQEASPVFPQAEITSPRLQVTVHLPDPHSGYYRGTRFDWSGAIASLRWQGHIHNQACYYFIELNSFLGPLHMQNLNPFLEIFILFYKLLYYFLLLNAI